MRKRFGIMFMRLGNFFMSMGYDLWWVKATETEKVNFVNARLKPLGLEIQKPQPYIGEYGRYDN